MNPLISRYLQAGGECVRSTLLTRNGACPSRAPLRVAANRGSRSWATLRAEKGFCFRPVAHQIFIVPVVLIHPANSFSAPVSCAFGFT